MQIKNHHYLILALLLLGFVGTAYATGAGFYLGGMAGQSNLQNKPRLVQTGGTPAFVMANPTNTGFGARLFLGYGVNPYFAVEGGWTYYTPSKYKTNVFPACGNPEIQENTIDVVGKGMVPFSTSGFSIFAKGGIAMASLGTAGRLSSQTLNSCANNMTSTSLRPVAGIGVSYDMTQSWVVDLSYTRVFSGSGFPSANLAALGISYHFVNAMCGQFLC